MSGWKLGYSDKHSVRCTSNNHGGNLRIGLRTLTYIVGWYNVEDGETAVI